MHLSFVRITDVSHQVWLPVSFLRSRLVKGIGPRTTLREDEGQGKTKLSFTGLDRSQEAREA